MFERVLCAKHVDGRMFVWDRDTGTRLAVLEGHDASSVNAVAWTQLRAQGSGNGNIYGALASCSDDATVRIWGPLIQETLKGLE